MRCFMERCVSSTKAASHLRPSSHELTRLSISWPDGGLATRVVSGARTVGPMQNTGSCRAAEVMAQISEYELFFLSASKAHLMARRCPPKRDVARAVWDRSSAELLTGVFEFHGSFRSYAARVCWLARC